MIYLTKLDNNQIVLNNELIQSIEWLPDTIITLTTGQKIIVKETVSEIIDRIKEYKVELCSPKKQCPTENNAV